jgi:hypothetical protein
MPLNMQHPVVQAELSPPQLVALGNQLKARYGQPASAFGIKGDENHLTGYHRSFNTLTQVPGAGGWNDYSIQSSLDNTNLNRDDCSACDFTPASWGSALCRQRMIEQTSRVHQACLRGDSRVRQLREFAGTLNGSTIVRFRNDGTFISPFDSSHLWHWHASFYRSRVRWDHSGLLDIIVGEDDMLTPDQDQRLKNIHDWTYDFFRGLVTADAGTPHITTYVPNEILTALRDRPPVVVDPAMLEAAVVAALQNPDVLAALKPVFVAAANEAEDS